MDTKQRRHATLSVIETVLKPVSLPQAANDALYARDAENAANHSRENAPQVAAASPAGDVAREPDYWLDGYAGI